MNRPPRIAEWLLSRVLEGQDGEAFHGDLVEAFHRKAKVDGVGAARRWYSRQAISVALWAKHASLKAPPGGQDVPHGLTQDGRWRMERLWQDVAYAARSLLKAPGFTAVAVLTLALGVGANSAIFSVVDAVLLRPLPFPDAERVVNLAWDGRESLQANLSSAMFGYWRDNASSLGAVATWRSFDAQLDEGGDVVRGLRVSRDFLEVVGYPPALGRDFTAGEDVPGGPRVALISHAIRRSRFQGSADVVGRTLRLGGEPYTVIGVLSESFAFPHADEPEGDEGVGVIVPLGLTVDPASEAEDWPTIARLAHGIRHGEAGADVAALTEAFRGAYPQQVDEGDRGMTLPTFSDLYVRDAARALWILMGAVGFILLIACANVANLFLARAERRRGEIALRAALGATRSRIVQLILTESVLVALTAGAIGLLLARWGIGVLMALVPVELPRMASVGIDWRVLAFTFSAALATALAFGGAAALPATRAGLGSILKESAWGASGRSRSRQGLVVVQSALSMVLLVGAGLLLVTLIGLRHVDPGFDREGLVAARFPVEPEGYETPRRVWELQQRVQEQASGFAAVHSVAGASNLPLERGVNVPISIEGRPEEWGTVEWRAVTPGYFRTLRIPLVAGRTFETTDTDGTPSVAIVNEAFARRYFPGERPIGKRIEFPRARGEFIDPSLAGPGVEIVGVVGDIREVSLRTEPRRTMYVPQPQASPRLANLRGTMPVFIARGTTGRDVGRALMEALRSADPALPRPEVLLFDEVVDRSLARERFGAALVSMLAALALILTALGIYGVLAYSVRQRRREIGIRIALGADRRDVTRLVVGEGIAPVLIGLLLGLAGSIGLARVLGGYLWGVEPTDPATLGAVALILLGVGFLSSWLPAREAVRLKPLVALSSD